CKTDAAYSWTKKQYRIRTDLLEMWSDGPLPNLLQQPPSIVLLQVWQRRSTVQRLPMQPGKHPRICPTVRPEQIPTDEASLMTIPLQFPDHRPHVMIKAFDREWDALVDTEATCSFVNRDLATVPEQHQ